MPRVRRAARRGRRRRAPGDRRRRHRRRRRHGRRRDPDGLARVQAFLEAISLVTDLDERRARGHEHGHADDAALREGARVPGRVPHRPRGRRVPARAQPRRSRRARRGAPPLLRRASHAREERLYLCHAWSRMLFGATDYRPPSRFLDEIPDELVHAIGDGPAAARAAASARTAKRSWRPRCAAPSRCRSSADGRARRRGARAAHRRRRRRTRSSARA